MDALKDLDMDPSFADRYLNEGFSGGERKRNEILQMVVLQPDLAILDETDSGLDIDALKIVAEGIERLRDDERGIVLITHYQRMLDYLTPDVVHVMLDGRIVETGGPELADEIEDSGYDRYRSEAAAR
jgi:Fe-S cluster assembly ATP-binding protein